jgi:hypothetical protein
MSSVLRSSRAAEEGGFGWKYGSTMASGTRGFLQPANIVPNVGTKSGGREEDEGMNDPRSPEGGFI